VTDIQPGVPTTRSAGRGFRAYTAKHRFPFEPACYEAMPDELPGLFPTEPDEPGELMVPAI